MITPRQLWYPLFFISGPAVSALLITYTTKKSFPRWLGLGFIGYISYLTFESANGLTSNHRDNGILASLPFIQFCHAANLLLINAIDRQDLPSPKAISDNFVSFSSSLGLFVNFRGIGTKWVVKNTPRFPNYYQTQSPGRAIFYFRQLALVVWLYLLGDMIGFSGTLPSLDEQERMFGEGTEYLFLDATTEQWGARISSSLMTWFLAGRVFMCCYYSMFSLVCIAVGLSSPKDWPPAFNSVSEAYTLRNFWGNYWHQWLRWPLSSVSSHLTEKVMRLPKPSILERYTNIFFVFTLSGILHVLFNIAGGKVDSKIGTMLFFQSFAFGIMVEDGIQAIWRRLTGEKFQSNGSTSVWKKFVGFIWVAVFMIIVTPWFVYPITRVPAEMRAFGPVMVTEKLGIQNVAIAIVVGAVPLWLVFKPEP